MYRICLLTAVLLFAATVRAEDGSDKKSGAELHGTWAVTTSESRKSSGDEWKDVELPWNWKFKPDGKTLLTDRKLRKQSLFRYEVDVSKQPHRIELEYLGPESGLKGYRQLGIWKIRDSKLTMHLDPPGSDEYPTEFKGTKQSGFYLELEQMLFD